MKQKYPEEIPQDYTELFSGTWMTYISREVRRRNKVLRDFEDVLATVTEKLFAAKVLDKFVAKAATRQPEVLSAEQACAFLGITWWSWFQLMHVFHHRNPNYGDLTQEGLTPEGRTLILERREKAVRLTAETANRLKAAGKKNWLRKVPTFMPTPVQRVDGVWVETPDSLVLHRKALFRFSDIQRLDTLIDQNEKIDEAFEQRKKEFRKELAEFREAQTKFRKMSPSDQQLVVQEDGPLVEPVLERPAYSNVFPSFAGRDRPHYLPVTGGGFKTYLLQAIHRHFLNNCRTNRRRFNKEHPMSEDTILVSDSSGTYHKGGAFEGIHGWEEALVGETLDSDDLYDCVAFKRKAEKACLEAGIDLSCINEFVRGSASEDGAGPTPEALRAMRVLEAVGDGTSLAEAIRKVQVKTRMRSRTG